MPVAAVASAILLILKLTNIATFDWIWVFAPLLIVVALLVVVLMFSVLAIGFVFLIAVLAAFKSK